MENIGAIEKVEGLPSGWQLVTQSWTLYKQKFVLVTGIAAVMGLIIFVINLGILNATHFTPDSSPDLLNVMKLVTFVLGLFVQGALIQALAFPEQAPTVARAYMSSKGKIGMMLLVGIIVGLIVAVGTIAFIVPGILFALWFGFSNYVVIVDGLGEMKAMKASRRLVVGRANAVLWRWICGGLTSAVPLILISLIITILPINTELRRIVGTALSFIFVSPWFLIFGYLLFTNLKRIQASVTPPMPRP